jgi:hypothetical protein
MTEEDIGVLFAALREERALAEALPPLSCPGGLTLARARALALAPGRGSAREWAHLDGCAHCRRTVATLEEELPHPERWALLRWALGWEEGTAGLVEHVEEDGCERCRAVCEPWRRQRGRAGARLAGGTRLPNPLAAVADEARGPYRVTSPVGAGALRWCLHQEGAHLVLDVASGEEALLPALVRYTFTTAAGAAALVGFIPLARPDREGQCVAHATFDAQRLHSLCPEGACELTLAPVPAEALSEEERRLLGESVHRAPSADWQGWLARQEEQARPALRALLGPSQGPGR